MDSNGLNFWMLSQAGDWPMASQSASPSVSSLAESLGIADTQIVLETPLPGSLPAFVLIDSEVMSVGGVDQTGLQLAVTRGAQGTMAMIHPAGAVVWGSVGTLQHAVAAGDTQLTVTPPQTAISPGTFLQIGAEVLSVTQIDWTKTILTVTRGAMGSAPAAYPAGAPVFSPTAANLYYCTSSNTLQLLSMRLGSPPVEDFTAASALVETAPMTQDAFGNYARWDPISSQVMAGGSGPGEVSIFTPPGGQTVTDLAMGYDGILYIAVGGNLALVDRQGRWPNFTLSTPKLSFWRLAALPEGGVLALDRTPAAPQLGKVTGAPLQTGPVDTPNPGILRSCQPNPTPPTLTATYALPSTESFVAFTMMDKRPALLSWAANSAANTTSFLRVFHFQKGIGQPWTLSGARWPYALAWLGSQKLAVLATGLKEALVFDLSESGSALIPAGDTYVLAALNSGPFAHGLSQPPYYAAGVNLGAPQTLVAGAASLPAYSLAPGTHYFRAVYSGDTTHPAATSAVLIENVVQAGSSVTLSSSANPSTAGSPVTFTATVSPAAATGNVQFLDGTANLGTEALSAGVSRLTVPALAAGAHPITAAYGGDTTHPAAQSAMLPQSVVPNAFVVALAASPNPALAGQTVTLTAQLPSAATGTVQFQDGAQLLPLLPVSLNSMAGFGSTDPRSPKMLDSGVAQTVWHRLFLEAVLPPRCSVVVWLTASDQPSGIASSTAPWYPHAFGDADMSALAPQTPQGVWIGIPSEVPFAQPLLSGTPVPHRQGLFTVLVQRTGRLVRNLSGRFLGIRVDLHGDRRSTPQIAALRVWAPRFSYVNHYLPELYRENKFSPAADQPSQQSTRRDFFERFVDIFEAQMTRIEDRVANSYLLTRAETTPDSALDWLGGWVGMSGTGYPPDRKRARLRASASLHRKRGTVKGVIEALNIATNGLCRRGAVIVVEDYRLRHIFATILGANLAIQNDPLLPGYNASSNSFVGSTLFLGNPKDQAEILALFSAPESTAEESVVQQFYDSLANRMTVFIHNQVETVDVKLVQRIVEYEKPAHVAATVRIATQPFMVGLAALVGVDSYLAPDPPRNPVVVGSSQIGRYNMVIQNPSLDPRMET